MASERYGSANEKPEDHNDTKFDMYKIDGAKSSMFPYTEFFLIIIVTII